MVNHLGKNASIKKPQALSTIFNNVIEYGLKLKLQISAGTFCFINKLQIKTVSKALWLDVQRLRNPIFLEYININVFLIIMFNMGCLFCPTYEYQKLS